MSNINIATESITFDGTAQSKKNPAYPVMLTGNFSLHTGYKKLIKGLEKQEYVPF